MNKQLVLLYSMAACIAGTLIGYFCLLYGATHSEQSGGLNILLLLGYLLMWPVILYGYIQDSVTGSNDISTVSLFAAQVVGYLFMGYMLSYVYKYIKNT